MFLFTRSIRESSWNEPPPTQPPPLMRKILRTAQAGWQGKPGTPKSVGSDTAKFEDEDGGIPYGTTLGFKVLEIHLEESITIESSPRDLMAMVSFIHVYHKKSQVNVGIDIPFVPWILNLRSRRGCWEAKQFSWSKNWRCFDFTQTHGRVLGAIWIYICFMKLLYCIHTVPGTRFQILHQPFCPKKVHQISSNAKFACPFFPRSPYQQLTGPLGSRRPT